MNVATKLERVKVLPGEAWPGLALLRGSLNYTKQWKALWGWDPGLSWTVFPETLLQF